MVLPNNSLSKISAIWDPMSSHFAPEVIPVTTAVSDYLVPNLPRVRENPIHSKIVAQNRQFRA